MRSKLSRQKAIFCSFQETILSECRCWSEVHASAISALKWAKWGLITQTVTFTMAFSQQWQPLPLVSHHSCCLPMLDPHWIFPCGFSCKCHRRATAFALASRSVLETLDRYCICVNAQKQTVSICCMMGKLLPTTDSVIHLC